MDVVTAVSGSSPAYVFMFIEAMADAAVAGGMPRQQAYKFAAQAVLGSAKMVLLCDSGVVGNARPCQGRDRGFEPRLSLFQLNICGCSSMVEHQPSKLDTWVRFPSPAYAIVA